jgi:hypothetical protein
LDPPYRPALVLDNENMSRLNSVDSRPIFKFKPGEIECVMPPRIDVRLRKPSLQQREVGPVECAE